MAQNQRIQVIQNVQPVQQVQQVQQIQVQQIQNSAPIMFNDSDDDIPIIIIE